MAAVNGAHAAEGMPQSPYRISVRLASRRTDCRRHGWGSRFDDGRHHRMTQRPLFLHAPWMVGVMLILGVMSLVVGLTIDPFWLVMGSPAILTLFVYIGVRVALSWRLRRLPVADAAVDRGPDPGSDLGSDPGSDTDDRRPADDQEPSARPYA